MVVEPRPWVLSSCLRFFLYVALVSFRLPPESHLTRIPLTASAMTSTDTVDLLLRGCFLDAPEERLRVLVTFNPLLRFVYAVTASYNKHVVLTQQRHYSLVASLRARECSFTYAQLPTDPFFLHPYHHSPTITHHQAFRVTILALRFPLKPDIKVPKPRGCVAEFLWTIRAGALAPVPAAPSRSQRRNPATASATAWTAMSSIWP